MIREFLKTIRIRYDQIVRFIKMNDERILEFEYRDFMKLRKIVTKWFASYTSSQNDKIERSEKILMIKTRTMKIETNLSINMWSKVFKSIDYLNNRILRRALTWKTFFEVLIEEKSNLTHLQSYECRTYFLKNIILRKNRLKSKAFIDYLIRYDFINIFRIWISSRMRVVRIRDVIFDKTLFYDLAKLDSKHLLIISVKETLKIIEISNNIFFEVFIEKIKTICRSNLDSWNQLIKLKRHHFFILIWRTFIFWFSRWSQIEIKDSIKILSIRCSFFKSIWR
jgi:hypothetical protein